MNKKDVAREARLQGAYERLGNTKARCLLCGETNPHCLRLFEQDHIAGRRFHEDTLTLCLNCHRKRTDMQKDAPAPHGDTPSQFEVIGQYLLGIINFLTLIIERLREFAELLLSKAAAVHAAADSPK